ncbi:phosphoribosyltransferase [Thalassococcus sp. CAU 1522]|uniref:Phosphoribosyltransferase n=1 Tax=Thalassococcus arenae TaxID=2851652 RepID=A0ABS6N539_9RHOB|nr:phosphoribosyltransferase family protein [Thalassococcus arenae]MBV2359133.1 phosphoribosyltransferase [Thalassococcus arenae]
MASRIAIFVDRADAGRQLAAALPALSREDTVVTALPRGGVPVAAEICAARALPLDLVLVRKIGAPGQPELAIGAVADGDDPVFTINRDVARAFGLSPQQAEDRGRRLLPEIERRRALYLANRRPLDVTGKTVVVVDDGVATGATLIAAIKALRARNPERILVAMPVGPRDLHRQLQGLADEVICLRDLSGIGSVGGAYRRFDQVDDDTVRGILTRFQPAGSEGGDSD